MQSKKYTLNAEDKAKILKNAQLFLLPALLVFLTAIQQGMPVKQALISVYLWALNTLIDVIKKYTQGK
jgi:hypothetical protein